MCRDVFHCALVYRQKTLMEQKLYAAGSSLGAPKALRMLKPIHLIGAVFQGNHVAKCAKFALDQEAISHAISISEVPEIPVLTG